LLSSGWPGGCAYGLWLLVCSGRGAIQVYAIVCLCVSTVTLVYYSNQQYFLRQPCAASSTLAIHSWPPGRGISRLSSKQGSAQHDRPSTRRPRPLPLPCQEDRLFKKAHDRTFIHFGKRFMASFVPVNGPHPVAAATGRLPGNLPRRSHAPFRAPVHRLPASHPNAPRTPYARQRCQVAKTPRNSTNAQRLPSRAVPAKRAATPCGRESISRV
jgi:hypothetical protein